MNTLIYSMDDEADDILASLKLTTAEGKSYITVKEKFNSNFVIKRNVISGPFLEIFYGGGAGTYILPTKMGVVP